MWERDTLFREISDSNIIPPKLGGLEQLAEFKLEHISQDMKRDTSTNLWVPDGIEKPLQTLNPGFVDANDDLKLGQLDNDLKELLKSKPEFNKFFVNKSGNPAKGDKFHIALIDLTDKKLLNPELAGWGSTVAEEGGSVAKVAILYATFQLLNDLKSMKGHKTLTGVMNTAKKAAQNAKFSDPPKFHKFLDLRNKASKIEFSSFVQTAVNEFISHESNQHARYLIHTVGFSYIGSLMLKSGLYHPKRGGIWLIGSYSKPKITWSKPFWPVPKPLFRHNVTALSLATFFALLAQRRLVTPDSSDKIKKSLSTASYFLPILPHAKIASKVGLVGNLVHEAGLIENGRFRYAVAILTNNAFSVLEPLIAEVDQLIQKNNP